ncbi:MULTISPECIES: helix-turn-helix domain-containing protein [Staphylococcus]|jgi:transcriptional regulator with XRE-family HTH domain|uniref:helix-turn-helix domain-containing protein n=1 Tax=Staphylococcus TaxID=1279 RepID=UPI000F53BFEB|nr:helix-turn-helix transcriptional regulator [Staphylococcus warneri]MBC3135028.1 helix-turn-helix transcriptional regulator [Staphylococcus warneri]MBF0770615.1 helix-turn-helix transcriptional regulator [Staphylococcus warneri]MCE5000554.1 helix-turn-helix transcriptional regulator [Staphylococcus warneri]MCI2747148.1 helix-turn-helix domain-containing protein [Staphylococcus warneri]MCI2767739.1 helix-turn-helix domain-containing protein [Staphylococcus warneri]
MEYKSARKILSENLDQLMKENNVTQIELSEAIGVSQSTISNWLKEVKYPRISKIQELANYFNVPKSRITEDKNEIKQNTMAAHFDKDGLTEEEIEEVKQFIEFVKNKRK